MKIVCQLKKSRLLYFSFLLVGLLGFCFSGIFHSSCLWVVVFKEANKIPFERNHDLVGRALHLDEKTGFQGPTHLVIIRLRSTCLFHRIILKIK